MQIDFHHTITYIVARLAGFDHEKADIIAYCSQYVDDATNPGTVFFDNGASYSRISSAHKTLDYRNFEELANHLVWIPFHFLPGCASATFTGNLICKPGSSIAEEMLAGTIATRNLPYGLHRLGIAMHVYADTWAHQGFAGVCDKVNDIRCLDDQNHLDQGFLAKMKEYFHDAFDKAASRFVGRNFPLGHGAALSCPDLPYLSWSFRDSSGNTVNRDNATIFTEAADAMCKAMQRFLADNSRMPVAGLSPQHRNLLTEKMYEINFEKGEDRHEAWLEIIARGDFGFSGAKLQYIDKGKNSWKYQALNTADEKDDPLRKYHFQPAFLDSNWKKFHDALQLHRFVVLHDILPRHEVCAG